jgi:hypothetical protein
MRRLAEVRDAKIFFAKLTTSILSNSSCSAVDFYACTEGLRSHDEELLGHFEINTRDMSITTEHSGGYQEIPRCPPLIHLLSTAHRVRGAV